MDDRENTGDDGRIEGLEENGWKEREIEESEMDGRE